MQIKELTPEQLLLIKKPLPPDAVKDHPTKKGMSTIKAIFVTERLNEVFGVGRWHIKTDLLPVDAAGSLFSIRTYTTSQNKERTEFFAVSKTVFTVPEYDICYECIAGASNDDMGDAAKGSCTDAITKICSYIGIGIDVFKGQHDQSGANWEKTIKSTLKEAIRDLLDCDTVEHLTDLKGELPDFIVEHRDFVAAAKQRFLQITAQTPAAPVTEESEPSPEPAPVKPGSLGVNIVDGKGNMVDVGKFLTDAVDMDKTNAFLRWLRIKQQEGYEVKAWMDAMHDKAITTLGLTFDSEKKLYYFYQPVEQQVPA